jgi:cell division protease FtsH
MSEELGATALGEKEHEVFLGRDIAHQANYSETTAHSIDKEIQRFVTEAGERVDKLLKDYEPQLHAVSKALLEHDSLSRDEVAELIYGKEAFEEMERERAKLAAEAEESAAQAEPETEVATENPVEASEASEATEAASESPSSDGNGVSQANGSNEEPAVASSEVDETVESPKGR